MALYFDLRYRHKASPSSISNEDFDKQLNEAIDNIATVMTGKWYVLNKSLNVWCLIFCCLVCWSVCLLVGLLVGLVWFVGRLVCLLFGLLVVLVNFFRPDRFNEIEWPTMIWLNWMTGWGKHVRGVDFWPEKKVQRVFEIEGLSFGMLRRLECELCLFRPSPLRPFVPLSLSPSLCG